jgi:hypothetical protein
MQFEDLDKKIIEAAEHHHPAYNEVAWHKMGKLLDKHFPQKKDDKRRIIFFLLFSLLLSGGIFLIVTGYRHSKRSFITAKQKPQLDISTAKPSNNSRSVRGKSNNTTLTANDQEHNTQINLNDKNNSGEIKINHTQYVNAIQNTLNSRLRKEKNPVFESKVKKITDKNDNEKSAGFRNNSVIKDPLSGIVDQRNNNNPSSEKNLVSKNPFVENISPVNKQQEKSATRKNDSAVVAAIVPAKKNLGIAKKRNSFFVSLSAGPDISALGVRSLGKITMTYGAGIGFSFHDKFSIRTGFYSARKIYTASPDEYHPPSSFWTYYPNLKKVDADCRVFEIPLLVSYNFNNSGKYSLYGTLGISSYLMKRETYDYLYKNSSGQLVNRKYTIRDKNHHYFSVLTLAGGYRRKINNTFSFMAEPYLKIPFDGIGFGKMQLNSAGVLFSLGIKPFHSSKNK